MKTMKRKGFTLVELLVVIAILAILAGVGVAGYTAFIERAYVSNDNTLVTQLNSYLVALKADSNSKHYGEDIDENNIWEITGEILKDTGINELAPQAAQYGYHFYFDLEAGEYVVMNDKDVLNSLSMRLFDLLTGAADRVYDVRPGNCFTKENRYFLVDTQGSDLADVVRGFYTFEGLEGETTLEKFQTFAEKVQTLANSDISALVGTTVFATDAGNLVLSLDGTHTLLLVHDSAESVANSLTDGTNTVLLGGNNYLLNVSKDTTIALPAGIKLPANSLYVNTNGNNVTVKLDANNWNEVIDLVDAEFAQSDVTIVLGGAKYELFGNEVCIYQNGAEKGALHTYLKYNNPLYSFDLVLNADNTTNKVYNSSANLGYVALDKKDFTLSLNENSIVGVKQNSDATDTTVVSTRDVEWSVHPDSEGVLKYENGKFTFASSTVDTVKVVATATVDRNGYAPGVEGYDANNRASQTYEIKVVRLTGATLELAGKPWSASSTLVHSGSTEYNVAITGTPTYVNKIAEIELDETLKLTYTITDGADLTTANGAIGKVTTTTGNGTGTLTVSVGDYVTYTTNITIFDTSSFVVTPKQSTIYVGNGNTVTFADLFNGTAPAGAEIRICSNVYEDDDYMNFNRGYLADIAYNPDNATFYVSESNASVNDAIQFYGTSGSQPLVLAVYHNGVRISDDITTVNVVNGTNIREYASANAIDGDDLTSLMNDTKELADSVVLLNEIKLSTDAYFTIPAGKTFHGNLFKVDATGARNVEGIIMLKGTLKDTKVVGSVYNTMALSIGDEYGAPLVYTNTGALVDNCYLANTRSPIRINDGTVTIKDTVLFGGRYANIDIVGGTVNIQGEVTTVQQPVKDSSGKTVMGVGIAAWYNDIKKFVVVEENADLIQYNFMNQDISQHLPEIDMYDIITVMDLKKPFNDILTNYSDEYGFVGSDGKVYVNAGIVATDAYMIDYAVTGNPTGKGGLFGGSITKYVAGNTVVVKLESNASTVPDSEMLTVHYDSSKFEPEGITGSNGMISVSAATLRQGVTFKATTTINLKSYLIVYVDPVEFMFLVSSNDYKTVNVSGCDGKYKGLIYTYPEAMFDIFATGEYGLEKLGKTGLTGRGLHYGKITVDVQTPLNTENGEYDKLLDYYIANVTGGDQVYLPDNYVMSYGE